MDALTQLNTALSGRYAIDREIGRGGMAMVYLARDLRHNRHVALKVLNPELGAVLGVERFLAEIQVTANLQHPNLLPLFDSGEADGLLFYVMPYVDGESLRGRLEREKQLPVDEAFHIAAAVASALDYAHRHGVIHRDLKPENILLHEGQPMVADFGIALAVTNAGGNRITQTGLSLGTPQYMSPEQATGDRAIDGRTDIYSLGAVTYEMLTGEPPHIGTTAQAVIAKVLTDRPRSIRLTRATVPERVEAAVERALAKIPADRYQTARDFADALTDKGAPNTDHSDVARALSHGRQVRKRSRLWAVALPWVIAAASAAFAILRSRQGTRDADGLTLRYEIVPPAMAVAAGPGSPVAVSPDGRFIAYVAIGGGGARRLYLRSSDDLQSRAVPGSDFAENPFFSPDGHWIGFWAGGQLRKADVAGGGAIVLGDLPTVSRVAWAPGGRLVVADNFHLATLPAAGGALSVLSRPQTAQGETGQAMPVVLADGKTILYQSVAMGGAAASRIGIASLETGTTRISDVQGSYPLGIVDGNLVYTTADGAITAVPFDLRSGHSTGAPVPFERAASDGARGESYADLSREGSLVFVSAASQRRVVSVDPSGVVQPVLTEPADYAWPRLSPLGTRLAITKRTSARSDVWVYDLPSGPLVRLTVDGMLNDRPEWSPDGRSILFRSNRGGRNAVWMKFVDGSTPAKLLFGANDAQVDEGVISPDGRWLLFQRDASGRGELWYRAMQGDTTPRRIGTGTYGEVGGRFSPDGKWIVSQSSESGVLQIIVRPFPSLGARYQVSLDGGATPVWSPDGKRIYYVAGNQLIAATIKSTAPFTIASRTPALGSDLAMSVNEIHADYDVFKDGRTVIAPQAVDEGAPLVVVRNWPAELRARMRGRNPQLVR